MHFREAPIALCDRRWEKYASKLAGPCCFVCVNAHHYRFAEPISNIIKWFPFPPLRLMSDMEEDRLEELLAWRRWRMSSS